MESDEETPTESIGVAVIGSNNAAPALSITSERLNEDSRDVLEIRSSIRSTADANLEALNNAPDLSSVGNRERSIENDMLVIPESVGAERQNNPSEDIVNMDARDLLNVVFQNELHLPQNRESSPGHNAVEAIRYNNESERLNTGRERLSLDDGFIGFPEDGDPLGVGEDDDMEVLNENLSDVLEEPTMQPPSLLRLTENSVDHQIRLGLNTPQENIDGGAAAANNVGAAQNDDSLTDSNMSLESEIQDAANIASAAEDESSRDSNMSLAEVDSGIQAAANNAGAAEDNDSSTDSNMSLVETDDEVEDEIAHFNPPRRWLIPQHHVNAAIRELVSQARHSEGGIAALLNRENFMQRVRNMIYSWEHTRHRRNDENVDNDEPGADRASAADEDADNEPFVVDEVMLAQSVNDVEIDTQNAVRFDTNLPAEHSYFGANCNRVPGVNYLDVGGSYNMLIFMHHHLLFPGDILPFMINGSVIEAEMERSGQEGIIFGIVFPFLQEAGDNPLKMYGVTCQIYEKGQDGRDMFFFKSRALQRFVTNCSGLDGPPQYIASNPGVKCYGVAKILPEIYLPEPLKCINMGSMNRFRDNPSMQQQFKRFQAATTVWPAHVYEEYSVASIVELARKQLEKHKIDTMPSCPIQLSYWLVRNLHLTEKLTRTIFMTDSVNTRLKLIASTFKEDSLFYCRYCNNSIAYCHELFAMSKHGVQTQYCNSAGYIHETNTVYRLMPDSVTYSGEASSQFSWFPGYQWRIIVCKFCTQHIGWEFKAIESNLVPKLFFGLSGSSVRINKKNNSSGNILRPFVYRSLLRMVSRQME